MCDLRNVYFTFHLSKLLNPISGSLMRHELVEKMPTGNALQMSSPDDHRVSNSKGSTYQSALNMLAMLLPGATLSYYGEEIGLLEIGPDDNTIGTYTSQLGRAVRCDFYFSSAVTVLMYEQF